MTASSQRFVRMVEALAESETVRINVSSAEQEKEIRALLKGGSAGACGVLSDSDERTVVSRSRADFREEGEGSQTRGGQFPLQRVGMEISAL